MLIKAVPRDQSEELSPLWECHVLFWSGLGLEVPKLHDRKGSFDVTRRQQKHLAKEAHVHFSILAASHGRHALRADERRGCPLV
jgi:hypothetical protein